MNYRKFIEQKHAAAPIAGFSRSVRKDSILFGFQRAIVEWAWSRGRAAIFADTGLGKTGMQLEWADGVVRETGKPVLGIGPLAVIGQTAAEAQKFGIEGVRVVRGGEAPGRIDFVNYERVKHMDIDAYGGVVLDESSILKNPTGATRNQLVRWFANMPYRLACSATPAPNDHTELGNHAEWLGVMDEAVMRANWFLNDTSQTVNPWRLKKHAVRDFWRWVSTWSRSVSKPSDMGDYDDTPYDLLPLNIQHHTVDVDIVTDAPDGMLFRIPEMSATSIHNEKRRTLAERVAEVKRIVATAPSEPWVVWCETNYEQDALIEAFPRAIDVRGNMKPEQKAAGLLKFTNEGGIIVTKPSIAGMGLNWQHSNRMVFAGGSYSYESFYQAVRRSHRFGQTRPVTAHVVMASTEVCIWQTIHRKSDQHAEMRMQMLEASRKAAVQYASHSSYDANYAAPLPAWIHTK